MKLQFCTITGADDAVDVKDLSKIAKEYPFVEWATLWMPERAGMARFPTAAWIKNFKKECSDSHISMHLCGQGLLDFVDGKKIDVMAGFSRIQLNLKFNNAGDKCDLAKLAAQVKAHPNVQFILQYTADKKDKLLPHFENVPNHALLFDASAGSGVRPEKWDAPVEGHFCGYAGGLNPDNVGENLKLIERVTPPDYTTWIDMETGVRTNDVFDLDKVRRVLKIAEPYVKAGRKITPRVRAP